MEVAEWIFWGSVFLIVYPYALYPLGLGIVYGIKRGWRRSPADRSLSHWPEVTIVIPAYKEADSVKPKMESLRQQDYPSDKMRILWVIATHEGDESFTPTLEALKAYPEAEILVVPHRGKIYSLNEARKHITTPYALITDADVLLSPQALKELIRVAESHPATAIVGGVRRVLSHPSPTLVEKTEIPYLHFDERLGTWESLWGYALGLWGGLLLLKTPFWPEMPDGVVDDLYLNLHAILSGGKVFICPQAQGHETLSPNPSIEFRRKSRIAYTAFHVIHKRFRWKEALRVPLFSFFFLSHKVFRYLFAPLGLCLAYGSSLYLTPLWPLYALAALLQTLVWSEAILLLSWPALRFPRPIALPAYFVIAHWAQLAGLWKFLTGADPLQVWQRLPRSEIQPTAYGVGNSHSSSAST